MDFALIFDMDGLLVDSEVIWQKVERELLAAHGAIWNDEVMRQQIGMRLDEGVAIMLRGHRIEADPLVFATALVDGLLREFAIALPPMPGALALMAEVGRRNLPAAIASSSPRRVVAHVVAHFGWGETVRAVCAGDEVARGKPAPDIFLLAAARLAIEPGRCLVLEDSLNGARAAQAAGMRCLAVPNPAYTPADFAGVADWVVASLEEVNLADLATMMGG